MPIETWKTFDINALNERSREIFREIVETYLETGAPVGSRTLAKRINGMLSPASIRNIMSDLESAGLLSSPHTSAGRQPTDMGMRMFIDGLLEVGDLTEDERAAIEAQCARIGRSMEDMLIEASEMLSGLSGWAGMVTAPKTDSALKHIDFVSLGEGRALVVMVSESGGVENRIVEVPLGMPPSVLTEASNYLNARLRGRTLAEASDEILSELNHQQAEVDQLTARVVESGLATWVGGQDRPSLIIRGRANLLDDPVLSQDFERIRQLLEDLDSKHSLMKLLDITDRGHGVRIFIGSESQLFSLSGSTLVVAPYSDSRQRIVGAIGVIGPTYLNYAHVVPMVDYTASVIGRLIG